VQAVAEEHDTAKSWLVVEPGGFGVVSVIQSAPSQCAVNRSTERLALGADPTPTQNDSVGHDTAKKDAERGREVD
jgi:hypothetical protein